MNSMNIQRLLALILFLALAACNPADDSGSVYTNDSLEGMAAASDSLAIYEAQGITREALTGNWTDPITSGDQEGGFVLNADGTASLRGAGQAWPASWSLNGRTLSMEFSAPEESDSSDLLEMQILRVAGDSLFIDGIDNVVYIRKN